MDYGCNHLQDIDIHNTSVVDISTERHIIVPIFTARMVHNDKFGLSFQVSLDPIVTLSEVDFLLLPLTSGRHVKDDFWQSHVVNSVKTIASILHHHEHTSVIAYSG